MGNPPYQSNGAPIYDKFFDQSERLSHSVLMITKGAWTKGVGRKLSENFLKKIMSKKGVHIKMKLDMEIFKGVAVGGGLTEFYWRRKGEEQSLFELYSRRNKFVHASKPPIFNNRLFNHPEERDLIKASVRAIESGKATSMRKFYQGVNFFKVPKASGINELYFEGSVPYLHKKDGARVVEFLDKKYVLRNLDKALDEKIAISKFMSSSEPLVIPQLERGCFSLSDTFACLGLGLDKKELDWLETLLRTKTIRKILRASNSGYTLNNSSFNEVPFFKQDSRLSLSSIEEVDLWLQEKLRLSQEVSKWIDKYGKYHS